MNCRYTLALALLFPAAIYAPAAVYAQDTPQQQKLFEMTNQARTDQGLKPLQWDAALATAAQQHAQKMVDQKSLSHQLPGEPDLQARAAQAGAHFREISENVAMGGNADAVQKEWMRSEQHRANILDAKADRVGIGVVEKTGYWYAVVDFDSSVDALDPEQIEQKVAAMLKQKGIDPSGSADAARKDCAVEDGDASGSHALFVMRWESSNLDQLPPQLVSRMQSGKYKTAAVGACSPGDGHQGFTTYRIAVLLY